MFNFNEPLSFQICRSFALCLYYYLYSRFHVSQNMKNNTLKSQVSDWRCAFHSQFVAGLANFSEASNSVIFHVAWNFFECENQLTLRGSGSDS